MDRDQPGELVDQPLDPAGRQVGRDPLFEHREPQLLQPDGVRAQAGVTGPAQGRAPPQGQRRTEEAGRLLVASRARRLPSLLHEPLEDVLVQGVGWDLRQIAHAMRGDDLGEARAVEGPAQRGDIGLQHATGGRRRVLLPDRLHQPLDADRAAGVEEQGGEQGARLGAPESDLPPVVPHLDRAQEPELHRFPPTGFGGP